MDPKYQRDVIATAIAIGEHVRVGMEGNLYLANGEYARSNT